LDEKNSTPHQPILLHRREQKLKKGEVVELNIEIWASSTHFAPREGLRLLVQGTDVMVRRVGLHLLIVAEISRTGSVHTTRDFGQQWRPYYPYRRETPVVLVIAVHPYSKLDAGAFKDANKNTK
jgi:hypothetical protein